MKSNIALIIIDVQVIQFAREKFDGKKVYEGDRLLKNIYTLTESARTANVPVIYLQYTGSDDSIIGKGKPLWEIHPRITPQPEDIIIAKDHADGFYHTDLHERLQSMGVTDLIIVGIQTEYCVDTTCRRAFSLGYNTILVSDGHSTVDSDIFQAHQIIEYHNYILGGGNPFAAKFVELKKTEEIKF